MKRQNPLLSSLGFVITGLMLLGVGWMAWRDRGLMFSPGPVSAQALTSAQAGGFHTHADFEKECRRCHAPLDTTQDVLCLGCHTGVQAEIQAQAGAHGRIPQVNRCAACHAEHQGRDFDMLQEAEKKFDHSQTRFSLVWHQVGYDAVPLECPACHADRASYAETAGSCAACHADHDPAFMAQHERDFGPECPACHDGQDRLGRFNHAATAFPLEGRHLSVSCAACHTATAGLLPAQPAARFQDTSAACQDCHAEPPAHQGLFSAGCAGCHSAAGWTPARWEDRPFDHETSTHFSLQRHRQDASSRPILCLDCHPELAQPFDLETCVDCHARDAAGADFMRAHQDRFGPACLDCHDGADRMSHFDHAHFFPLEGAHAALDCESCHNDKVFAGTPSACVACHAEPEIHRGFFGLECQDCHTAEAWSPARLLSHTFPLDHGGQGTVPCQVCHPAAYVDYTCYGCHEHEPKATAARHAREGVSAADLPRCADCHAGGE